MDYEMLRAVSKIAAQHTKAQTEINARAVTIKYGTRPLPGDKHGIRVKVYVGGQLDTDDMNTTPWPTEAVALERASRSALAEAQRHSGHVTVTKL